MPSNHGSEQSIVRTCLHWACLPEACSLALATHGEFATPSPLQLPPARGASEGRQASSSTIKGWPGAMLDRATRRPGGASRGRSWPAMSPNYKKGGGRLWLAGPQKTPRRPAEAGTRVRGGSSLVWLVQRPPASCRRKQEKQKKKENKPTGGDLVGHYYVVGRLSIDQHSTAQPGPARSTQTRQFRPSKQQEERGEKKPRRWHGIAWHNMA